VRGTSGKLDTEILFRCVATGIREVLIMSCSPVHQKHYLRGSVSHSNILKNSDTLVNKINSPETKHDIKFASLN
jgi:coenzyme F420-reducing hydrogenase delta subunit